MPQSNKKIISFRYVLFLCLTVALYSSSGIFSKLASGYGFLTWPYFLCIGGVIFVLGIYAILWQIALQHVALSRAYLFRSLGVIYSLAIATLVFHESVTVQNLFGCAIIVVGLIILLDGN